MTAPVAGSTSLEKSKLLNREAWRDLAVSLSLVNLAFLRVWTELLAYTPEDTFAMFRPPPPVAYVAAILNVLIWGIVLFTAVQLVRLHPTRFWRIVAYAAFFLTLVFCGNALRAVLSNRWEVLRGHLFKYISVQNAAIVFAVVLLAAAMAMVAWRTQITAAFYRLLLIAFPFVFFTFGQAAWRALHPRDISRFENRQLAAALPARSGSPRIVWIIFDEFDYRLTFTERPSGLELPELDRFRAESVSATNAYPPAAATSVSMPALIIGKTPLAERILGVDDLRLRLPDSDEFRWSSRESVFEEARKLGVNTALVGWYLPYCRILTDVLTRCWWCEMENQTNSNGDRLLPIAVNQARSLLETSLFSPFGQSLTLQHKVAQYHEMQREAVSVATDSTIGLSLLHFAVPHSPFVYNRHTRDFSLANAPITGYVDALALTDRTLGEIRRAMEQGGQWDSSVVLVSADHFDRYAKQLDGKSDRRIPFLLKLPFQKQRHVHSGGFNSIVTKELLLTILRGEMTSPSDVDRWLDKHNQDAR